MTTALAGVPVAAQEADRQAYVERILAVEADPAFGAYLSSQCATCHMPGGRGTIPPIDGMAADALVGALFDFRSGAREGEVMRAVALGLEDEDVAALAAHFGHPQ